MSGSPRPAWASRSFGGLLIELAENIEGSPMSLKQADSFHDPAEVSMSFYRNCEYF
jgi:hypothetical protein